MVHEGNAMTHDITYHVHADYDMFKDVFVAQHTSYLRKVGLAWAVIAGFVVVLSVFGFFSAPDLSIGLIALAFVVLFVMGLRMAICPFALVVTRADEVRRWFSFHGARTAGVPLRRLEADYDVVIGDEGFSEKSSAGCVTIPWNRLRGTRVRRPSGDFLPVDDGKQSSLAYNAIGLNWALREEGTAGVLVIPSSVLADNPALAEEVLRRIAVTR